MLFQSHDTHTHTHTILIISQEPCAEKWRIGMKCVLSQTFNESCAFFILYIFTPIQLWYVIVLSNMIFLKHGVKKKTICQPFVQERI